MTAGPGSPFDARRPLCADVSRADAEPLGATASRVGTWILIEYRGLWARDAVDGSTLTSELKSYLRDQRAALPHSRILFVRRTQRRGQGGLLTFVARTSESEQELRCIELERHDDLLGLDLTQAGRAVEHPLFLVCTHGKHDRCCAKFGRPLYDAVSEQVDDGWVWQSSHVGGDRFAGNLVSIPSGVYYGRVELEHAWSVLECALQETIFLPHYRGRSCHSFPVQAADRALREETGLRGVADVRLREIERDGEGWRVVLSAGGELFELAVHREEGPPTHLTCSTPALRRPHRYVARSLRVRAS